ncbi:MAG TPA: VWA domain-containing protein, partial [Anaerolineae bacterium]|nr:VWA domain-containing protein [Anaerolineae bacterium]
AVPPAQRKPQPGRGRRSQTIAVNQGGHYIRAAVPQGSVRDVAVDATLRAAALRLVQGGRGAEEQGSVKKASPLHPCTLAPLHVLATDLRVKIRNARTGNLILFVVDASGSMGARQRMIAVKGAMLSLLLDAYQKRDRVGLIAFRGQGAEVLVPPTNSVELAEQRLRQMPTGGRTPLAAALQLAERVLAGHLQRDAALTPLLVLITDGRPNVGQPGELRQAALMLAQKRVAALVLDSEQNFVRLGAAQEIAAWLEADYLPLDGLRAGFIAGQVRQKLNG